MPLGASSTGSAALYVAIMIAAAIEGEVTFVGAAALVSQGVLSPAAVVAAGATGAALGDQFYFYALRGPLRRWLLRKPALAARSERLIRVVRRHDTLMALAIRFAPGLRIALAAACACAGVRPLKLSLLNAAASLVWAVMVLTIVAYLGPAVFKGFGISGWWGTLASAGLILALLFVMTFVLPRLGR